MKHNQMSRRIDSERSFEEYREAILGEPSVRDWVKRAIRDMEKRDAVDVAQDLLLLTELLRWRLVELRLRARFGGNT